MFVPAGYVKLEGATVNRSNYPRLVRLADEYSLWTSDTASNPGLFGEGDGSTTMTLPNWTGRMAQFAATAGGKVDAGVPNIFGTLNIHGWTVMSAFDAFGDLLYQGDKIPEAKYSATGYSQVGFKASRSNSLYGSSNTVQPPAINVFAIMRY
jgi:hypothetical protein